jgi:hypothetical protein
MELLQAYKHIPLKGKIIRFYEFHGHFRWPLNLLDNGGLGMHMKRPRQEETFLVLAENFYDAVFYLRKTHPEYFPEAATVIGRLKISRKTVKRNDARFQAIVQSSRSTLDPPLTPVISPHDARRERVWIPEEEER